MKEKIPMGGKRGMTTMIVLVAASAVLFAAVAMAKGPPGVKYTVHNLSSGNPDNMTYYSSNEDEICIFCHTPHGGSLTGPLWNRSNPTNSYQRYNSVTLSSQIDSGTAPVNDESLLCLSCHDGSLAVNRILNESNTTTGGSPNPSTPITAFSGGDQWIMPIGFGAVGPAIGASPSDDTATNDLRDDHPISFSFRDVYDNATPAEQNELIDPTTVDTGGAVRLFGSDAAGGLRVECSTCHDPHVNYDDLIMPGNGEDTAYTPFLITPNTGSAMCLTCHNK